METIMKYTMGTLKDKLLPKDRKKYIVAYPEPIYTGKGEINVPKMEMLYLQRQFVMQAKALNFSDKQIQEIRTKFLASTVLSEHERLRLKAIPDEYNYYGTWRIKPTTGY